MINKIDNIQIDSEIHMKNCINNFKTNINNIHIGRISPKILNNIRVDYYGISTPLSQLANTVAEDSRTLAITVFDHQIIKSTEKAIFMSDLQLIPISHGNIIRVTLPALTEERRRTLIKMVRSEAEKSKIAIRNVRRIANDKTKILLKNKEINEDEEHFFHNEIQKLTNIWIKKIDIILTEKESELMKF
ncbi:ribosome recycling factor [Blochmannia endosymbiont of Camponotus sp. C-003]|uniref:ribosome recycling factor n=1 Tax=unclassified Candidatus Blochmanniella TaxID=711328 RepID=UPI0020259ADA|nr:MULTISPECIES: ribosome recycling factor [unclassified Candidatus Blochmannia]URJ23534.1 ribosome recycling factor [Blochmannia endosymbiont of Camponotus sp. C-003]URJ29006.1 ribosome recycling factor [Blochmannia endosymbiont of Camponotus sp. C-046]